MSFLWIIILLIVVIFVNTFLAIIVLFQKNRNEIHISYAVWALAVALWAYTNAHFQITTSVDWAYWLAILSYISGIILVSSMCYFSFVFPYQETKSVLLRYYKKYIFLPAIILIILVSIPGSVLKSVDITETPRKLITTPLLSFYALYILISLILLYYNFIQRYRSSRSVQKKQLGFIILGFTATMIFGVFFNLILPLIGNYSYVWLGPDFTLIMITSTAYAILKHRLFDINIQIQRFVNIFFPLITSTIIFALLTIIVLHNTNINPIIIGIFALVGNIFLYEFFRARVSETRFSYVLFQRTHKYQKSLKQLAQDAPSILDLDTLTKRILASLVDEMRIDNVAILMNIAPKNHTFELLQSSNYTAEQLHAFLQPSTLLIDAFSDGHISYVCDEIEYTLHGDITLKERQQLLEVQRVLQQAKANLIIALRSRQSIMGFIILGEKPKGKPYTTEDIDLLEDISKELAIALINSKMHQDKVNMTKLLQTEVDKAVTAWKQKSQENEELSRVRSQFIDVTSHQLRTPISVIRNSLLLILEDYLPQTEPGKRAIEETNAMLTTDQLEHVIHLLNNAFLASENLRSTADNILAVSEMIGSNPSVNITQIDTKDFFDTRVRRARRLFKAKPDDTVGFHVELQPNLPAHFVSDEKKMSMVLDNLLSNAILYTLTGEVTFSVNIHEQHFVIRIVDTGIGIRKDDQEKLFQRFIRFRNAQRVVPDGNGLGLYLAKEYTELLRGHIAFTSIEEQGTTVTITIPIEYSYLSRVRV
ncbi:MAG: GAF domain-containing protein [Candidatus Kerfeldbacteria bacterium]|nr:GAF domain-containing protein [Candidatus Kerfeldbacteria bacterium]